MKTSELSINTGGQIESPRSMQNERIEGLPEQFRDNGQGRFLQRTPRTPRTSGISFQANKTHTGFSNPETEDYCASLALEAAVEILKKNEFRYIKEFGDKAYVEAAKQGAIIAAEKGFSRDDGQPMELNAEEVRHIFQQEFPDVPSEINGECSILDTSPPEKPCAAGTENGSGISDGTLPGI